MKAIVKIYLSVFFLLISTSIFAQNGERVLDHNGDFSICPPLNWNVIDFPGLKYKAIIGPASGGFAANIVFVNETYTGNLKDYVSANLTQLKTFFQEYKLSSRSAFKTNSGITGERVIYNFSQQGFNIKATAYFLPAGKGKYFVITCGSLDSDSDQLLSTFDESIKSFELTKYIKYNRDSAQKEAVYAEIQNEFSKLDPFECRSYLSEYVSGSTYVEAKYRDERGVNWGTLVIHSPINASANLHIRKYRYRRGLSDPREIYYLLNYMRSFVQFEARSYTVTTSTWL